MPAFNCQKYIGESIQSVLTQSMPDLELIVVNDGSTDKTLDICNTYANSDNRVIIINRANSGAPCFPKNDGIAAASGEYIAFLDADDLYDQNRLELMVNHLENKTDLVAVFHDLRLIDENGYALSGTYLTNANFFARASTYMTTVGDGWSVCSERFFVFQSLFMGAMHTQSVLIAPARITPKALRFDTQFTIGEDTDQWIRIGLEGKIGFLNQVLSSYRYHESSITRNQEKALRDAPLMHHQNLIRIRKKITKEQVKQYKKKIASYSLDLGYLLATNFRLQDARREYLESLKCSPSVNSVRGYIKTFFPIRLLRSLKRINP